ncbi:MAG: GNAT family N-acyltransferase [Verrucomicrobiales bacterium]
MLVPQRENAYSGAMKLVNLSESIPALARVPGAAPAAERLLSLDRLNVLAADAGEGGGGAFLDRCLAALDLRCRITEGEAARIPAAGPAIAVSNHPFGGADALILLDLLTRRRADAKVMANSLLGRVEPLRDRLIFVDPFGGSAARRANAGGLRAALDHVRSGGLLGIFPAGEVSHLNLRHLRVEESAWSEHLGWLVERTGASVVPLHFTGRNSWLFQAAGMLHPLARTALLPREMFSRAGSEVCLAIGEPIPAARLRKFGGDAAAITAHLRGRLDLLAARHRPARQAMRPPPMAAAKRKESAPVPVAGPGDPEEIAEEIGDLPASALLFRQGDYAGYCAHAGDIPEVLREIGRLREITFRAVGEGTGREIDLDRFDATYRHLILWNDKEQEIVGAYRAGLSDELLLRGGESAFYSSTLFKFQRGFLARLDPAIELGRSFIVAKYQRQPQSLLLLWKAIGHFVAAHPWYRHLFGPVSISQSYGDFSRSLLVSFLRQHCADAGLSSLVRPINPFKQARRPASAEAMREACQSGALDDLGEWIAAAEQDGKGVPILLKQYLRLGARVLQFNIDAQFSNVLDGLVAIDLPETDPKVLARYMTAPGVEAFRAFHRGTGEARGRE